MVKHMMGLAVRLGLLFGLAFIVVGFTTPSGSTTIPYCFECWDGDDLDDGCEQIQQQAPPGWVVHQDIEEEDWENGNVHGEPHDEEQCNNIYNTWCGGGGQAHTTECFEGQQDIADLKTALEQRDFRALAVLVTNETGHVKFNTLRGSIQIASCDRQFIDANIPLSKKDISSLQRATRTLELRQATKTK